jgi:serine/threonine protein kinase
VADAPPITETMIGNFRLLRTLGEGGMGVVYEAEHVAMGRRAAVKVLRPELLKDQQAIRRFFNEARATNEIRHPGIVQIYDCGTSADGSPWLIMELLEGETLSRRIARMERLTSDDVINLGGQAASVLEAAHGAGIIHRDLKPDNLFVVPDLENPTGERVKVLDFGIAKLSKFVPGGSMPTQTGTMMGTPLYMSPEQCRGTKQIDARSDIYSLGLMLYQMTAGELPFMSDGIGELFDMQMNRPPPRLEQKVPTVNPGLAAAIHKTLEKNPADRYQTMAELHRALVVAGDPAAARPQNLTASAPRIYPVPSSHTMQLPGSSTTLSAGAVETELGSARRSSRALPLVIVGMVMAGGGALALRALVGHSAPVPVVVTAPPIAPAPIDSTLATKPIAPPSEPSAPATPPTQATPVTQVMQVMIDIKTNPADARVIDPSDGHLLGVTPLHQALARQSTARPLRIEKEGYLPKTMSIPPGGDFRAAIRLERAGSREPREPREPSSGEHIIKL